MAPPPKNGLRPPTMDMKRHQCPHCHESWACYAARRGALCVFGDALACHPCARGETL